MCSVEMRIFSACLSVRKGELTVGRDLACLAKPRRQGVASGTNCSGGRGSLWGLCPCTYSDRTVLEGLLSSGDGEDTNAAILAANVTLSSVGLCVCSPCHHHPRHPLGTQASTVLGGRDLSHSTGTRSASPASVDKLHGLHGQCGGHNVVRAVSANSNHHQPVQLAHDENQVTLKARTPVRTQNTQGPQGAERHSDGCV